MLPTSWRTAAAAAALIVCATLSPRAQATVYYSGNFDPPLDPATFVGSFLLGVGDPCFTSGPGVFATGSNGGIAGCFVDLISAHVDDCPPGGLTCPPALLVAYDFPGTKAAPFETNIANFVEIDPKGLLVAFSTFPSRDCVRFQFDLQLGAIFNPCTDAGPSFATYLIAPAPVPEPGTLALVLSALGAGWLTRRRRPAG